MCTMCCPHLHRRTTGKRAQPWRYSLLRDWSGAFSFPCRVLSHLPVAPLVVIVVFPLLVNQHSSPVNDRLTSRTPSPLPRSSHHRQKCVPTLNADVFTSVTPGAALDSPTENTTRLLFAPLKLVTRVLIIFPWRILAKPNVETPLCCCSTGLHWRAPCARRTGAITCLQRNMRTACRTRCTWYRDDRRLGCRGGRERGCRRFERATRGRS
ncbi:hypothetical protein EDB86DRAFT_1463252 [Lactarius hatsudake]|nr:hypothetical protein EDB86DRAFT_1463252 [Lactarius hatsudake]